MGGGVNLFVVLSVCNFGHITSNVYVKSDPKKAYVVNNIPIPKSKYKLRNLYKWKNLHICVNLCKWENLHICANLCKWENLHTCIKVIEQIRKKLLLTRKRATCYSSWLLALLLLPVQNESTGLHRSLAFQININKAFPCNSTNDSMPYDVYQAIQLDFQI